VSLLVVGSLALDTIETPFGKVEEALGGSATYISTASSYFAPAVNLVGVVGGDFPQSGIEFLASRNIGTEGIETIPEGKTFRWSGRYHYDLNMRDTLYTHLNVFEQFDPKIPAAYKKSEYVCLGNIDPVLQRRVLEQIDRPKLVVGDTMNFWIDRKRDELVRTIGLLDVLIINDSEARLLADEANLFRAAKKILTLGVKVLIIKKGEHGALLITHTTVFSAPAYPLENIFDPTGAGDTFAGGFIGYLAKTDDISDENMKKAVIYGSAMASFCVEEFSLDALRDLTYLKIQDRYWEFRTLSKFEN
jgi:sugar/nucleoside kinase (ribokinase family)